MKKFSAIQNKDTIHLCVRVFLCLFLLVRLSVMACNMPISNCPDENMRGQLAQWIFQHRALPTGFEDELIANEWGFSYASVPMLPAIVSAVSMAVFSLFSRSGKMLLIASRVPIILSALGCALLCLRIGDRLFKRKSSSEFLMIFVCFIPQLMFCGAYFNYDVPALFGAFLILYCLIRCTDQHWRYRDCIALALALAVVIMSYYNAYGWVLMSLIYCLIVCARDEIARQEGRAYLVKRLALVAGIDFLLCGWFFIRNMMLYNGDALGVSARASIAAAYEALGHTVYHGAPYSARSGSAWEMLTQSDWVRTSVDSFFGMLGYMDKVIDRRFLSFYKWLTGIGLAVGTACSLRRRDRRGMTVCFLAVAAITAALSVRYSFLTDYEPQGRYLFPAMPAVGILTVAGYEWLQEKLEAGIDRLRKNTSENESCADVKGDRAPWLAGLLAGLCLLVSSLVYSDTVTGSLFLKKELEKEISLTPDRQVSVRLDFKAFDEYDLVRYAIWSEPDQGDIVWRDALPAPVDKDRALICWTDSLTVKNDGGAKDYIVHVYGFPAGGEGEFIWADKVTVRQAEDGTLVIR